MFENSTYKSADKSLDILRPILRQLFYGCYSRLWKIDFSIATTKPARKKVNYCANSQRVIDIINVTQRLCAEIIIINSFYQINSSTTYFYSRFHILFSSRFPRPTIITFLWKICAEKRYKFESNNIKKK